MGLIMENIAEIQPLTDEEKDDEVVKIKARMFDLMVHRDQVNQGVQAELSQLTSKIESLSKE